jgi:crossover junction endodeoxyribonuclease RuvC
MTRNVLGVDIGNHGALALVSPAGELVEVVDMPILADGPARRPAVNAALVSEIISRWKPARAFVEYVSARPGEAASGAFAFGRCKGVVEGVLASHCVPAAFLTPADWKRRVGVKAGRDGAKDAARSEAIRRWPAMSGKFARVRDDGRAEAALIAVAGLAKEGARHDGQS